MRIWVDADACPRVIKEILYRAAERRQVPLTLVANQMLATPRSPWITAIQVPGGFDAADERIAAEVSPGPRSRMFPDYDREQVLVTELRRHVPPVV